MHLPIQGGTTYVYSEAPVACTGRHHLPVKDAPLPSVYREAPLTYTGLLGSTTYLYRKLGGTT